MKSSGPDPGRRLSERADQKRLLHQEYDYRPNIIVGEYTYYSDEGGAEEFEKHVTHHYEFPGDKLVIGRFCTIARGVEFVMNGANHRMNSVTTYPFYIMGGGLGELNPVSCGASV